MTKANEDTTKSNGTRGDGSGIIGRRIDHTKRARVDAVPEETSEEVRERRRQLARGNFNARTGSGTLGAIIGALAVSVIVLGALFAWKVKSAGTGPVQTFGAVEGTASVQALPDSRAAFLEQTNEARELCGLAPLTNYDDAEAWAREVREGLRLAIDQVNDSQEELDSMVDKLNR